MIIKAAICDDEPDDAAVIRSYLNQYEMEYDIDFSVKMYTDGRKLLAGYQKGDFNLVFLDVEMPGINGLDIAGYIRRNMSDYVTKIVFVSNYPEYMQDSFNVQAFNYFPKPFMYNNFVRLMEHLLNSIEADSYMRVIINDDTSEELVNINDIVMIATEDSKNKRIKIIYDDRETVITGLLSDWSSELDGHGFVIPSRGLLVNMKHIHFIRDNTIILDNDMSIPLSRRNSKEIRRLFNRKLLAIEGNR